MQLKFKVADSKYHEVLHKGMSHEALTKYLALGKAKALEKKYPEAIIIGADTLVSINGKVLGKPHTRIKAKQMLGILNGKSHQIVTGLAIFDAKNKRVFSGIDKVTVYFKNLTSVQIDEYVASGEPLDRAGAYALQGLGFNFIKRIDGDLTTAIGLPMSLVYNGLQKLGIKI
jgi:septum formation protein